jgi:arsenate reductase-like glutaredoxin family protein
MAQTNSPPQAQSFRSGYAENSAISLRYLCVSAVHQAGNSLRILVNELFATYLFLVQKHLNHLPQGQGFLRELASAMNIELLERDYARQQLAAADLDAIFATDEVAPLLNTRHATYKERGWTKELPASDELRQAIIAEPNLLPRPITRRGSQVVPGFDQEKLRQLLIAA